MNETDKTVINISSLARHFVDFPLRAKRENAMIYMQNTALFQELRWGGGPLIIVTQPHLHCMQEKRLGKYGYRQGVTFHPGLVDFSEKRATYGHGPKTKKLVRQGKI